MWVGKRGGGIKWWSGVGKGNVGNEQIDFINVARFDWS